MKLKYAVIAVVFFMGLMHHTICQNSKSLDDIMQDIFGANSSCGPNQECVPYYLCKNGFVNTDGEDVINIRIYENPESCEYLKVCCSTENVLIENGDKKIEESAAKNSNISEFACGYRNTDDYNIRILGDDVNSSTEFGEFPWVVAILRNISGPTIFLNTFECSGTLISPTAVLTVAHCVDQYNTTDFTVRAGEWDSKSKSEQIPHQELRVRKKIIHEQFGPRNFINDIALLIVETPFVFKANVKSICLPPRTANFDESRCYTAGWGKNKTTVDELQTIIKKVELPIMPHNMCQRNLRTTRLGPFFELHQSFICAGGEKDKDSCTGDGGSPLMCPIPGETERYYQAGIVAVGIDCGRENIPGVYANIPYLRDWIDLQLQREGIDFSYFTAK